MKRQIRLGLGLFASVALLSASDVAWATHVPGHPGQNASVAQYVEQIPTSSGSQAPGFGATRRTTLPPKVEKQLAVEAGKDALILKEIATNSQYGAPQRTTKMKRRPDTVGPPIDENPPTGEVLSAVKSVVTDGSEGRLVALMIVLLAITGFAVAAAGYRQRAGRR